MWYGTTPFIVVKRGIRRIKDNITLLLGLSVLVLLQSKTVRLLHQLLQFPRSLPHGRHAVVSRGSLQLRQGVKGVHQFRLQIRANSWRRRSQGAEGGKEEVEDGVGWILVALAQGGRSKDGVANETGRLQGIATEREVVEAKPAQGEGGQQGEGAGKEVVRDARVDGGIQMMDQV